MQSPNEQPPGREEASTPSYRREYSSHNRLSALRINPPRQNQGRLAGNPEPSDGEYSRESSRCLPGSPDATGAPATLRNRPLPKSCSGARHHRINVICQMVANRRW